MFATVMSIVSGGFVEQEYYVRFVLQRGFRSEVEKPKLYIEIGEVLWK